MIWLSSSTVARLRDQLRERGQRTSVPTDADMPDMPQMLAEFAPLCEAMYLMMSADGDVTIEERDVLKGALRNLSDDKLRQQHIDGLLEDASKLAREHGREERLVEVAAVLQTDPARAEVAFVLAAAIAFADNTIADEENEVITNLADQLGIDEERANALLDQVEKDLKG
jgi:uncharacterized tellurite resistance protein B-like protein